MTEASPGGGGQALHLTPESRIRDLVNHPLLRSFAERLLPRDENSPFYDTPLSRVGSLMSYHGHVVPEVVVDALNCLIDDAARGDTVFYDFYSEQEQGDDPAKRHTGLFFYRGKPGAPFAIVCPGGGFQYVGSLQEGLPLAAEISDQGLNAFVIRYRISEREGTEDLTAAIAWVLENAKTLGVDTAGYSLWGGSAGARLVGNIAVGGLPRFGFYDVAAPSTVVIAYTGQATIWRGPPRAFIVVSADDPIANVATVERRVQRLREAGVDVQYHRYRNAGHGFGLGVGTEAEGWLDAAIRFCSAQRS